MSSILIERNQPIDEQTLDEHIQTGLSYKTMSDQ